MNTHTHDSKSEASTKLEPPFNSFFIFLHSFPPLPALYLMAVRPPFPSFPLFLSSLCYTAFSLLCLHNVRALERLLDLVSVQLVWMCLLGSVREEFLFGFLLYHSFSGTNAIAVIEATYAQRNVRITTEHFLCWPFRMYGFILCISSLINHLEQFVQQATITALSTIVFTMTFPFIVLPKDTLTSGLEELGLNWWLEDDHMLFISQVIILVSRKTWHETQATGFPFVFSHANQTRLCV